MGTESFWLLEVYEIYSPILFNLCLNEFPFLLDQENTDLITLANGSNVNCLLCADDLNIKSLT